jgi:hypothetical protein
MFKHSEAFSFQIATDNQEETDRYWNAIVKNGGQESQCGWCKDKWGLSWQITPRVLMQALSAGGGEAKRAFDAMMGMKRSTSPPSKPPAAANLSAKNRGHPGQARQRLIRGRPGRFPSASGYAPMRACPLVVSANHPKVSTKSWSR